MANDPLNLAEAGAWAGLWWLLDNALEQARDLRAVLAVVYGADRPERMWDLARHVTEAACRAHPHPAVAFCSGDDFGVGTCIILDRRPPLIPGAGRPLAAGLC